jgi:hypothetical protein
MVGKRDQSIPRIVEGEPNVKAKFDPYEFLRRVEEQEREAKADAGDRGRQHPEQPAPETKAPEAWPVMDEAAYHGIAGDFVKSLDPHTEADKPSVLIQFIVGFGSMVGNSPYYLVEGDRHHANMFAVIVGKSAKARKGTGQGRVNQVSQEADLVWFNDHIASGLSSGEGFIFPVRDPIKRWNAKDKIEEIIDPGVLDKRLLIVETEFASPLVVMERSGNNLSQLVRRAWDCMPLQTLTRNNPLKATNTHISIVGHITRDELRLRLTRTDMANGFANRFVYSLAKRSKLLPHGGHFPQSEIARLQGLIKGALECAKRIGRMTMDDKAAAAWSEAYSSLSADRPGLLGAVTARAEAQVIRFAINYALLDNKNIIGVEHLNAAMAAWSYCDQSATIIFGDSIGDPVADEILSALRVAPNGMTRTEISNLFGRHRDASQISAALSLLANLGRARCERTETAGRAAETWFILRGHNKT